MWRAVLEGWLMEEEKFEAIPDIATFWEHPATTYQTSMLYHQSFSQGTEHQCLGLDT